MEYHRGLTEHSGAEVYLNLEMMRETRAFKVRGACNALVNLGGGNGRTVFEYYRILNAEVKRRLGGFHSAKCILYSVDFDEIEACLSNGEWEKAGRILNNAARGLEAAKAHFILVG